MLVVAPAWGQFGVSIITGRVTDGTGAVVTSTSVVVVNLDTNFTYNSATNQEGLFRLPSLPPGPYRVTVEAAGFKRFLRENLQLRAGAILPVDAVLEVGTLTEQVQVSGEAPLLETETSARRVLR